MEQKKRTKKYVLIHDQYTRKFESTNKNLLYFSFLETFNEVEKYMLNFSYTNTY